MKQYFQYRFHCHAQKEIILCNNQNNNALRDYLKSVVYPW
jgi:hypothetical protein